MRKLICSVIWSGLAHHRKKKNKTPQYFPPVDQLEVEWIQNNKKILGQYWFGPIVLNYKLILTLFIWTWILLAEHNVTKLSFANISFMLETGKGLF